MSQLIRKPPGPDSGAGEPQTPAGGEPPYRWRTFFIWAAGIVLLFGVLIALRDLHIFPRPAGDDPEIVAAKATQQALMTAEVLKPRPTVAPTRAPAVAPTAQATRATSAPTSQPALAPTVQPTAAAAVAAAQPATAMIPTVAAPSLPAAPTPGGAGAAAPESTVGALPATSGQDSPTQAPAIDPHLAAQVLQAYQRYWAVRLHAMDDPFAPDLNLDSVMAGDELEGARRSVAQYQDEGEAYQTQVDHHAEPKYITDKEALIVDQYQTSAVKLDPQTKEPIDGQPLTEQRTEAFLLQQIGGAWKVVGEPARAQQDNP